MPRKKKKFIDKKHAVTFSLVHRSQQDPASANADAPQGVLVPTKRKEEQLKYGIEFDDDYDYLQHLRDVNELYRVKADVFRIGTTSSEALMKADPTKKHNLILPSNVFASPVETPVGILNRAAVGTVPKEEIDTDVMAALESEDIGGEQDEFEDDFIIQLNGGARSNKEEDDDALMEYGESNNCDVEDDFYEDDEEDEDDFASNEKSFRMGSIFVPGGREEEKGGGCFASNKKSFRIGSIFIPEGRREEEEKDDFSSNREPFRIKPISIPEGRKGTHLEAIDEKFAELYQKFKNDEDYDIDEEYTDSEGKDEDVGKHLAKQFIESEMDDVHFDPKIDDDLKDKIMECVNSDSDEEMVKIKVQVPVRNWDCESILSLRSNTSHLPKTIHLPKKHKNVSFASPIEVQEKPKLDSSKPLIIKRGKNETKQEKIARQSINPEPVVIVRDKQETIDEKKARKTAAKDEKKMRRIEKSETRSFFRQEKWRVVKQMIDHASNFQGSSIL